MFVKDRQGFSTVEYIVLFIVLAASFMTMAKVFKMFLLHRQKTSIESVWGYINAPDSNSITINRTGGGLRIR